MTVNVNTTGAGTVNGAIAVNYFSAGAVNGVSNGLGELGVGSSSFGVAGIIQASGQRHQPGLAADQQRGSSTWATCASAQPRRRRR